MRTESRARAGLRVLAAMAVALTTLACDGGPQSPERVTREFWEALRTDDLARARELASADSARRVDALWEVGPIEEVLLGDALQGETSAIVRTSLATTSENGRRHLSFDTTLVREKRTWKVDAAATHRAVSGAAFASSVQELGDALGEGVAEFGEALESGAEEISRAIREALEELERELAKPPPPPLPAD